MVLRRAKLRRELVVLGSVTLLGGTLLTVGVWQGRRRHLAEAAHTAAVRKADTLARQQAAQETQKWYQLDEDERVLTPSGAINCGVAATGPYFLKDRAPVDSCTVAAFKARKPFRASYNENDSNGSSQTVLIGTTQGHMHFLYRWSSGESTTYRRHMCKNSVVKRG
jgi:phage baseplate assembly protein gpV